MTKIALLTSATGGGGGVAAKRVYNSLILANENNGQVDLLDIKQFGGPVPSDVAPHSGGSNKVFSDTHFTVEFPGYKRTEILERLNQYDSINIHWCSYLLTLTEIKELARLGKTIVFTCHDYYYFLGGCHYPHTCTSWQSDCLACPQVDTEKFPEYYSHDNLKLKKHIFSFSNVWLTAPSQFLVDMATSILTNASNPPRVIRNPLDKACFNRTMRAEEDKDSSRLIILLVADSAKERRKAFPLGISAVDIASRKLLNDGIKVELRIVGGNADYLESLTLAVQAKVVMLGRLDPRELAQAYQESDIVFSPSLEDNWPNILVEAYACGTTFVVGPGHGCEEFVNRYQCGEVASSYEANALADAILKCYAAQKNGFDFLTKEYTLFLKDHDPLRVGLEYMALLKPPVECSSSK